MGPRLHSSVADKYLFTALYVLLPLTAAGAAPPSNGTESVTQFCGTIYEGSISAANHGVYLGQPYLGWLELIQEPPEDPAAGTTQWRCDENIYGCGTFHMILPGFVPPQFEDDPHFEEVDITGPVESIHQSLVTYRAVADISDFVVDTGPAYLGAVGEVTATILCTDCPTANDPQHIAPNFRDFAAISHGDMALLAQIPGIGGSLAPPGSPRFEVNGFITGLGGRCNQVLPSSSPYGLAGLVGLLVMSAIFIAGRMNRGSTMQPPQGGASPR